MRWRNGRVRVDVVWAVQSVARDLEKKICFFNDTAATEIYTEWIVGSVRCV